MRMKFLNFKTLLMAVGMLVGGGKLCVGASH